MDVEKKYKRAERRSAQPNTCTSDTPRTSEAEDCRRSSRAAVQCLAVSTFLMPPFADIWFAKRSQGPDTGAENNSVHARAPGHRVDGIHAHRNPLHMAMHIPGSLRSCCPFSRCRPTLEVS
jgi:hypothetical protein